MQYHVAVRLSPGPCIVPRSGDLRVPLTLYLRSSIQYILFLPPCFLTGPSTGHCGVSVVRALSLAFVRLRRPQTRACLEQLLQLGNENTRVKASSTALCAHFYCRTSSDKTVMLVTA